MGTLGTATDLFGQAISYNIEKNDGASGIAGVQSTYWEDAINAYANISLSSSGIGASSDDHLTVVGYRPIHSLVGAKGVEISRWLNIGNFSSSTGTKEAPKANLSVKGSDATDAHHIFHAENIAGDTLMQLRRDGVIGYRNLTLLPSSPSTGAGSCVVNNVYYDWDGTVWKARTESNIALKHTFHTQTYPTGLGFSESYLPVGKEDATYTVSEANFYVFTPSANATVYKLIEYGTDGLVTGSEANFTLLANTNTVAVTGLTLTEGNNWVLEVVSGAVTPKGATLELLLTK